MICLSEELQSTCLVSRTFNFDLFMEVDDLDSRDWTDRFQLSEAYRLDQLTASFNAWLNWSYKGVNFVIESNISDVSILKLDDQRTLNLASERVLINGDFTDDYCSVSFPATQLVH